MEAYNSDRYALFAFAPSILLISCRPGLLLLRPRVLQNPPSPSWMGRGSIYQQYMQYGFLGLSVRNGCEPVYRSNVSRIKWPVPLDHPWTIKSGSASTIYILNPSFLTCQIRTPVPLAVGRVEQGVKRRTRGNGKTCRKGNESSAV